MYHRSAPFSKERQAPRGSELAGDAVERLDIFQGDVALEALAGHEDIATMRAEQLHVSAGLALHLLRGAAGQQALGVDPAVEGKLPLIAGF